MSFGIKDGDFMMLEDYTLNFLHGYWNYFLIKTNIDVMMLFKFDIKYVKLNLKAITSMEFSFDLKLNLLCSYDSSLFMKNRWKLLGENSRKFSFTSFDRSRIPFDQLNVPFRSIKQESRIDQVNQIVYAKFIKISTNREFLSIIQICLFNRSNKNRASNRVIQKLGNFLMKISINWEIDSTNRNELFLKFH